jgi:hypothetical protein
MRQTQGYAGSAEFHHEIEGKRSLHRRSLWISGRPTARNAYLTRLGALKNGAIRA